MSVSSSLQKEIEEFAHKQRRENALLARARRGQLSPQAFAKYLASVQYLVKHTPVHLEAARRSAEALGDRALASHYANKVEEERGHDEWAADDLERVRRWFGVQTDGEPLAAMRALVDYLGARVTREPKSYLAYILLAEYFTVLMGPEWLETLEQRCGIPIEAASVVAKHVSLDRDHVAEGCGEIDCLTSPEDLPRLRETLYRAMDLFVRYLDDVAALA